MDGDLQDALAIFAKVEANLDKLDGVWNRIRDLMPDGPAYGMDAPEWRQLRLAWTELCTGIPPIDGHTIEPHLPAPDELADAYLNAMEEGDVVGFLTARDRPGEEIAEYRVRLERARRALARGQLRAVVNDIDTMLAAVEVTDFRAAWAGEFGWRSLNRGIEELEQLVGGLIPRRGRWSELHRHMHFAQDNDLRDIVDMDWPSVRSELEPLIFNELEPLPVDTTVDLGLLGRSRPARPSAGPAPLQWDKLDDELFERLIFVLLQRTDGYVDVTWLMPTRASDRGRDIQAYRLASDPLMPSRRVRIIIQCKHWTTKSVNPDDVTAVLTRMALWEPPMVEVVIIATCGRFTADAVALIEKREEARQLPRVIMLADSDLETLLSQHQGLIAEFGLR